MPPTKTSHARTRASAPARSRRTSTPARCWVNVISLEHVELGREGAFAQADHGGDARLRRLGRGDGILFYSPRTRLKAGDPVQQFTGLAEVTDDEPFQVEVAPGFRPWRRTVAFEAAEQAAPVDVRPLLGSLGFVRDDAHWGVVFRRGLFEIPPEDYALVRTAMRRRAAALRRAGRSR